ncbi:MAG: Gfo/Idh/MocA family oxidoreductase, partial [Candidatus Acidiferrales bacterium]
MTPSAKKYSVAIHGTGKRGRVHAEFFYLDDRFEVVGISGRDPARLAAAAELAGNPATFSNPAEMLRATKPDVFCFCTPPAVRLGMIRTGIEGGAKMIAYEKPMATS